MVTNAFQSCNEDHRFDINDLPLLLILSLACLVLMLLFTLHGVGVLVCRHYYH